MLRFQLAVMIMDGKQDWLSFQSLELNPNPAGDLSNMALLLWWPCACSTRTPELENHSLP